MTLQEVEKGEQRLPFGGVELRERAVGGSPIVVKDSTVGEARTREHRGELGGGACQTPVIVGTGD